MIFKNIAAQTGVLNFSEDLAKSAQGSVMFRAVGYGHGAQIWKDIVKAYMDVGYQGILSIENEDSFYPARSELSVRLCAQKRSRGIVGRQVVGGYGMIAEERS